VGTGLSYWGRENFQEGADIARQIAGDLEDIFSALKSGSDELEGSAGVISLAVNGSSCGSSFAASSLWNTSQSLATAAGETVDLVGGIASKVRQFSNGFERRVPLVIDLGVGFVTGIMSITVFAGFYMTAFGSVFSRQVVLVLSSLVLILFCPIIGFELTASVVISDFCVGLDDSFLIVAEEYIPSGALDLVEFYTRCNGTNPLEAPLDDSLQASADLAQGVAEFGSNCSAVAMASIVNETMVVNATVQTLSSNMGCDLVNPLLTRLLHSVVCSDVVVGIYRLWAVQLSIAFSLWALLFLLKLQTVVEKKEDENILKRQERNLGLRPRDFKRKGSLVPSAETIRTTIQHRLSSGDQFAWMGDKRISIAADGQGSRARSRSKAAQRTNSLPASGNTTATSGGGQRSTDRLRHASKDDLELVLAASARRKRGRTAHGGSEGPASGIDKDVLREFRKKRQERERREKRLKEHAASMPLPVATVVGIPESKTGEELVDKTKRKKKKQQQQQQHGAGGSTSAPTTPRHHRAIDLAADKSAANQQALDSPASASREGYRRTMTPPSAPVQGHALAMLSRRASDEYDRAGTEASYQPGSQGQPSPTLPKPVHLSLPLSTEIFSKVKLESPRYAAAVAAAEEGSRRSESVTRFAGGAEDPSSNTHSPQREEPAAAAHPGQVAFQAMGKSQSQDDPRVVSSSNHHRHGRRKHRPQQRSPSPNDGGHSPLAPYRREYEAKGFDTADDHRPKQKQQPSPARAIRQRMRTDIDGLEGVLDLPPSPQGKQSLLALRGSHGTRELAQSRGDRDARSRNAQNKSPEGGRPRAASDAADAARSASAPSPARRFKRLEQQPQQRGSDRPDTRPRHAPSPSVHGSFPPQQKGGTGGFEEAEDVSPRKSDSVAILGKGTGASPRHSGRRRGGSSGRQGRVHATMGLPETESARRRRDRGHNRSQSTGAGKRAMHQSFDFSSAIRTLSRSQDRFAPEPRQEESKSKSQPQPSLIRSESYEEDDAEYDEENLYDGEGLRATWSPTATDASTVHSPVSAHKTREGRPGGSQGASMPLSFGDDFIPAVARGASAGRRPPQSPSSASVAGPEDSVASSSLAIPNTSPRAAGHPGGSSDVFSSTSSVLAPASASIFTPGEVVRFTTEAHQGVGRVLKVSRRNFDRVLVEWLPSATARATDRHWFHSSDLVRVHDQRPPQREDPGVVANHQQSSGGSSALTGRSSSDDLDASGKGRRKRRDRGGGSAPPTPTSTASLMSSSQEQPPSSTRQTASKSSPPAAAGTLKRDSTDQVAASHAQRSRRKKEALQQSVARGRQVHEDRVSANTARQLRSKSAGARSTHDRLREASDARPPHSQPRRGGSSSSASARSSRGYVV